MTTHWRYYTTSFDFCVFVFKPEKNISSLLRCYNVVSDLQCSRRSNISYLLIQRYLWFCSRIYCELSCICAGTIGVVSSTSSGTCQMKAQNGESAIKFWRRRENRTWSKCLRRNYLFQIELRIARSIVRRRVHAKSCPFVMYNRTCVLLIGLFSFGSSQHVFSGVWRGSDPCQRALVYDEDIYTSERVRNASL